MRKILLGFAGILLLTGCVETMAFIGPTSSAVGGGNVMRSSLTSALDLGIQKTTGKSTVEHAMSFSQEHNPEKTKEKCVSFLEATESEVCALLKKKVSMLTSQINENSKIKVLD